MANTGSVYDMEIRAALEIKGVVNKAKALNKVIKKTAEQANEAANPKAETDGYKKVRDEANKTQKAIDKALQKEKALRDEQDRMKRENATFGKEWEKVNTELDKAQRNTNELLDEYERINAQLIRMEANGQQYKPQPIPADYSNIKALGERLKAAAKVGAAAMPGIIQQGASAAGEKLRTVLGKAHDSLNERMQDYRDIWRETVAESPRLRAAIEAIRERTQDYRDAWRDTLAQYPRLQAGISAMRSRIAGLGQMVRNINPSTVAARFGQLKERIIALAPAVSRATARLKKFGIGAKNDLRSAYSWITKVGRGFGTVIAKLKGVARHAGKAGAMLNKMKRGFKMGTGIKGLARLGLAGASVYAILRGIRQGFENLQNYGGETANSINTLKSSLLTMKNALATAFAPILNAVAPLLNTLIQWVTRAATAIAHFTAALTGKSTVVVAKPVSAVASAAGDAASNTGAANDAAKEYKKTLMGFDQINKLDDPTSSSGSGGSGGGGSGGGGAGDMFETVDVSDAAGSLADKIKESWKNADFTEIGSMLGEKLNHALESIPWDKIKETAAKIGKSLATFLNGFIETTDWNLVGKTFAEGINTIIEFGYAFVTNFHWDSFGKAIGDAINGFFLNIDWAKYGKTASNGLKGVLDALINAVDTIKWSEIGYKVVEYFTNIDWIGIFTKAVTLVGKVGKGLLEMLTGALKSAIDGLKKWISSGDIWSDLFNFGKATLSATLNILGAAWDLLKTIIEGGAEIAVTLIVSIVKKTVGAVADMFSNWFEHGNGNGEIVTRDGKFYKIPVEVEVRDGKADPFAQKLLEQLFGIESTYNGMAAMTAAVGVDIAGNLTTLNDHVPKEKKSVSGVNANATTLGDKIASGGKTIGGVLAKATALSNGAGNGKYLGLGGNIRAGITAISNGAKKGKSLGLGGSILATVSKLGNGAKRGKYLGIGGSIQASVNSMANAIAQKKRVLYGNTAQAKYLDDAIPWSKRHLKDMRATVSSVSFSSKAKAQIDAHFKHNASGGIYKGGRWHSVTAAANGGAFNQGQMFIAREAGPELVGTIGGHTAVVNNDQIVASVSKGVFDAVSAAMSGSGGQSPNVYIIAPDGSEMFKVMQKQAQNYTNATGAAAFPA